MNVFKRLWTALTRKSALSDEEISLAQLIESFGLHGVKRGALSEATYFACLKVLSESIGKLPLKIQQRTPQMGIRIAREHPWYRVLHTRPNPYMTASAFWSTMELFRSHYGNAYAWIDTRNKGAPRLWILHPQDVQVWYDDARVLADVPDVYYRWSTPQGVRVFGSEEVLHVRSHNTYNGLVGISVQEQLADTIQSNLKAQRMLNKLYDSGMTAKAVLNYTGGLNEKNVNTLISQFKAFAAGDSTGIIPVPTGFNLQPLNMKLTDSQFLEVKQYSALQIAAAFGVKPYQIGDYSKSSYSSGEHQQIAFLTDTLLFILKQYEEEIGFKLLSDKEAAEGYHVKFNTKAILRTDHKTQVESLATGIGNFLYSPNEAREELDLPWMPGGDQLVGNGNAIPITMVGTQYGKEVNEDEHSEEHRNSDE